MFRNEQGFTLIEVIISALILFSAVAIGTILFRTSLRLMDKAKATTMVSGALPSVMEEVRESLMEQKQNGAGNFGEGITYRWHSKRLTSAKNILSSYEEVGNRLDYGRFIVQLNQVRLTIIIHTGLFTAMESRFLYKEFSWH